MGKKRVSSSVIPLLNALGQLYDCANVFSDRVVRVLNCSRDSEIS